MTGAIRYSRGRAVTDDKPRQHEVSMTVGAGREGIPRC